MKIIQLNIFKGEVNEKLFPLLNGKIFHITSAINSNLILDSGKISGDTKLEKTHGVFSNDSYGRNRGYICLCDLRNWDSLSEEKKDWALTSFYFLNPGRMQPPHYFILNSKMHTSIIPWSEASNYSKESGEFCRYIANLECWLEDDILVQYCDLLIKVNFKWDGNIDSLTLKELNQLYQKLLEEE